MLTVQVTINHCTPTLLPSRGGWTTILHPRRGHPIEQLMTVDCQRKSVRTTTPRNTRTSWGLRSCCLHPPSPRKGGLLTPMAAQTPPHHRQGKLSHPNQEHSTMRMFTKPILISWTPCIVINTCNIVTIEEMKWWLIVCHQTPENGFRRDLTVQTFWSTMRGGLTNLPPLWAVTLEIKCTTTKEPVRCEGQSLA